MCRLVNGFMNMFNFRQGEEWHRHRTVLIKKMLRPKEVQEYVAPMNVVGNDFMRRLKRIANKNNGEVPNLEHEIFKWAMECKKPYRICFMFFLFNKIESGVGNCYLSIGA